MVSVFILIEQEFNEWYPNSFRAAIIEVSTSMFSMSSVDDGREVSMKIVRKYELIETDILNHPFLFQNDQHDYADEHHGRT